jgi:hypothetical protein
MDSNLVIAACGAGMIVTLILWFISVSKGPPIDPELEERRRAQRQLRGPK